MASKDNVILYGFWASPFAIRVELALKVKGIPYDYVVEDLHSKSAALIAYNPVYKKVPVLVHNGKPICESLVILNYIDEEWKDGPKLLPDDPYKKSQVLFWAGFLQQQLIDPMIEVLLETDGEALKKLINQLNENFQVLENNLESFDPSFTCISTPNLGLLDLIIGSVFGAESIDLELLGMKVLEIEKIPLVYSWITALIKHPLVKESTIPREKAMALIRRNALKSS